MIAEPVLFPSIPEVVPAMAVSVQTAPAMAAGAAFPDLLAVAMVPPVTSPDAAAAILPVEGASQTVPPDQTDASIPVTDSTAARIAALNPQGEVAPKDDAAQPPVAPVALALPLPEGQPDDPAPPSAAQAGAPTDDAPALAGALAGENSEGTEAVDTAPVETQSPTHRPEAAIAADAEAPVLPEQATGDAEAPSMDDAPKEAEGTAEPGQPVAQTADMRPAMPVPATAPAMVNGPITANPPAAARPVVAERAEPARDDRRVDKPKAAASDARPAPSPTKARKADHTAAAPFPAKPVAAPVTEPQQTIAPTRETHRDAPAESVSLAPITAAAPQSVAMQPVATAHTPPPAPPPVVIDTGRAGWENRFTDHLSARLSETGSSIEIRLSPDTLGPVTITVEMTDGAAQVQIVTETPEAARLFQQSEHRLADSMSRAGLVLAGQDTASRNPRDNGRDGRPRTGRTGDLGGIPSLRQGFDAAYPLQRRASGLLNIVA